MNKIATLVVLSICTFACLAEPTGKNFPFPRWTVERLTTFITPAPKDDVFKDLVKRKAAANIGFTYVDGVIDATEGRDWCFTGKLPSPEIDSDIKNVLDKAPRTARDKSAAKLILDYLRTNHPCPKTK